MGGILFSRMDDDSLARTVAVYVYAIISPRADPCPSVGNPASPPRPRVRWSRALVGSRGCGVSVPTLTTRGRTCSPAACAVRFITTLLTAAHTTPLSLGVKPSTPAIDCTGTTKSSGRQPAYVGAPVPRLEPLGLTWRGMRIRHCLSLHYFHAPFLSWYKHHYKHSIFF
jgi:hypothetical protein